MQHAVEPSLVCDVGVLARTFRTASVDTRGVVACVFFSLFRYWESDFGVLRNSSSLTAVGRICFVWVLATIFPGARNATRYILCARKRVYDIEYRTIFVGNQDLIY